MAHGDTKPPARRRAAFDAGAAEDLAGPVIEQRTSHVCEAEGCQLAASMRVTHSWACGYHALAQHREWPAITHVMDVRIHLVREINIGRGLFQHGTYDQVLGGHERAIERLSSGAELDVEELAFLRSKNIQSYATFLLALESLLGVHVAKVTSVKQENIKPSSSRVHTKTPHELLQEKWA